MKPLYARKLTDEERQVLRQSLKSRNGFAVRRAQMLLMSADEQLKVDEIGGRVGMAQLLGWTTGIHLHYTVFIDKNNDGDFEDDGELVDPVFNVDIHMLPGINDAID